MRCCRWCAHQRDEGGHAEQLEGSGEISVSRPKCRLSWSIPVPSERGGGKRDGQSELRRADDPSQGMYVWVDALSNYITAAKAIWGTPIDKWQGEMIHVIGKDIRCALSSACPLTAAAASTASFGLPYCTPLGCRCRTPSCRTPTGRWARRRCPNRLVALLPAPSQSHPPGNVVEPDHLFSKFGVDATRYFLVRESSL